MIDKNMPIEISMQELRLNIKEQYSDTLAFLVVDMAIIQVTNEITYKTLETLYKIKRRRR